MSKLSSDEKNRIYEEEKERLKAQGKIKSKNKGIGCLAIVVVLIVIGAMSDTPEQTETPISVAKTDTPTLPPESEPPVKPAATSPAPVPANTPIPELTAAEKKAMFQEWQGREKFVKRLISRGVVSKIENTPNGYEVWVTPLFDAVDFDTKQNFLGAIYGYKFLKEKKEPHYSDGTLYLYDSKTGKRIGDYCFSPWRSKPLKLK